ncbi:LD-carboxypeptidase [Croceicoccus sp. F390]|uniref:LD-carboxypeptidase n=1 Tax=Croceicoccus esteveae TaxID=3075597 RepID=A0ABU2ZHA8_9SPHN|nr:LD-carboxypeptidase [Croceicoccus sp. F390]MDT0574802.1 LD-carboxypeptidase [Croceicoccus sp. F390]
MTKIVVCAPSGPFERSSAAKVEHFARDQPGITLVFHEQCFARAGHFAGTDAQRVAALVACANDPDYDAVWFARGGYGACRIAEQALARMDETARGKAYLGCSDAGYLLAGLYRNGIGRPVHAPMPVDVERADGNAAISRVFAFLAGDCTTLEPTLDGRPAAAFNLTTLAMLVGTPLMPDLAGHVVMVEEVSEHLYAIDRLFFHLAAAMPAMKLAGLRLGRVSEVPHNDRPFGADAEDIARYWCGRAGVPFLGRANIGHDCANRIVPFGARDVWGLAPTGDAP